MKCKAFIFGLLLGGVAFTASAVELKTEGRDPKYVESIVGRSRKIVDKLELNNEDKAKEVTNIIANRYFKLNDIYEARDAKVKTAKESLRRTLLSRLPAMRLMPRCIAVISSSRLICRCSLLRSRSMP